jgi:hypothetical protein
MIAPRLLKLDVRSRVVAAVLILMGLLPALRAAISPSEWKNQQTLDVRETGFIKISVPDTTIDLARAGFADLRLLGPGGEEVPYVINVPPLPSPSRQAPRNFKIELQQFATQLTIETGTEQPVDRVTLTTPARDFIKAARIEISSDGSQWELAGDGFQVARQFGIEALTLPLGKVAAAYVRITIDDSRTAIIPFTGAVLHLTAPDTSFTQPVNAEIIKRDEFARETVLTVDLQARNLPLATLEITTSDPLFARVVNVTQRSISNGESNEQTAAVGSIFRSRLPQHTTREHLQVPLDFTAVTRELLLHITNENNAPLAIQQVRILRRPVWLIFNAVENGTYRVLTGNVQVSSPSYDLARFAADWQTLPETTMVLSKPEPNPNYQRRDALADTPLLGSALDVSRWKFRKKVSPVAAGVQELELDLEVLAHAEPGFSDLRLIRDGRQIPYLVERSPLFRTLAFQPIEVNDPKKPQLSRWKFSLPLAGLPIQRLTVGSSTQLFSRRLQVFELTTDRRGESSRRPLSEFVTWSSTPDRPAPKLAIKLTAPMTDTLYLEIDNGDNPPIALADAQVEHSVVRLLFRSDVSPLYLYYGETSTTAPKYDLELVASQLLNDEKNAVNLGGEERTDGRKEDVTLFSGKRGGIVLWASLALVVAVLLFAIARLLPKPPDAARK